MSEPSPHFYQAVGILQGTLEVDAEGKPILVGENTQYSIIITSKLLQLHQGQTGYWRVYPQTHKAEPDVIRFKVLTFLETVDPEKLHFQLKGNWARIGFQIWRNVQTFRPYRGPIFTVLPLDWENAPPTNQKFWEVIAAFEDGKFRVIQAEGPFPSPPHLTTDRKIPPEFIAQQKALKAQKKNKAQATPNPLQVLNWKEITPVPGKLDITVKFNTFPAINQFNGQYHLRVDCDGRIVQMSLKEKQWKKLMEAVQTYPKWMTMVTGKMGSLTDDGFVLESPTLQVFEVKPKEGAESKTEDAPPEAKTTETKKPTDSQQATKKAKAPAAKQSQGAKESQSSTLSKDKVRKVGKFTFEAR